MDPLTILETHTQLAQDLFRQGYERGLSLSKPKHARVVVCGMGGSILGAELFQTFAQRTLPNLEVTIWQTYGLPPASAKQTDIYCISYSGNTEETISAFQAARKAHASPVCLAHGGMLASKASNNHIPLVALPDTAVPRLVAPFVFGFFTGLYRRDAKTQRAAAHLNIDAHAMAMQAKRLARSLAKKQILVYTPVSSLSLAHLWEIHLNETAGLLAFGDDIPDIDHHTLAALNNASERSAFHALFLESTKQSSAMHKRIDLTKRTLGRIGIGHSSVAIKTNSLLESLLSNTAIASLSAIAIARKTRFNPFTNTIQDSFKKNLRIRP